MKKVSKIILINPKNKLLLLYLRDNNPSISYPGYWDFIGGEVEKGENFLEAVKREIKEEINCKVEEIQFLSEYMYLPLDIHFNFFKGKIEQPIENIKLTEGQKLRYFNLSDLPNIRLPPFFRDFIYKNQDRIFF